MSHFRLLGVPVTVRPAVGVVAAAIGLATYGVARWRSVPQPGLLAAASAVTIAGAELTHAGGHIVSARLSGAPMDRVIWGLYAQNGYDDDTVTPWQHIGRAVGGPIVSGLAVLLLAALGRALGPTFGGRLATSAAVQHGLFGLGGLAPLPMLDGGVILANARKLRR